MKIYANEQPKSFHKPGWGSLLFRCYEHLRIGPYLCVITVTVSLVSSTQQEKHSEAREQRGLLMPALAGRTSAQLLYLVLCQWPHSLCRKAFCSDNVLGLHPNYYSRWFVLISVFSGNAMVIFTLKPTICLLTNRVQYVCIIVYFQEMLWWYLW